MLLLFLLYIFAADLADTCYKMDLIISQRCGTFCHPYICIIYVLPADFVTPAFAFDLLPACFVTPAFAFDVLPVCFVTPALSFGVLPVDTFCHLRTLCHHVVTEGAECFTRVPELSLSPAPL